MGKWLLAHSTERKYLVSKIKYPFLCVHGAWGAGEPLCTWLMQDNDRWGSPLVRVPDLYGHGRRRESLDGISLTTYVKEIRALLIEQGPSILIGYSMGGLVCQLVANKRPDLVKGVILLSSTPPWCPPLHMRFAKPYYLWAMITGRAFRILPQEAKYFLDGDETGLESGRVVREELFAAFPVNPLPMPTLVIAGDKDRFFPSPVQSRLARFHGNHKSHPVFYPAGHALLRSSYAHLVRDEVYRFAVQLS